MFSDIQFLIDKGDYQLAKDKLNLVLNKNHEPMISLEAEIYNLKILLCLDDFKSFETSYQRLIQYYTEHTSIFYFQIQNLNIEMLWRTNCLDKALDNALNLNIEPLVGVNIDFKTQYGYLLYNLSRITLYLGDIQKSQSYATQSLEIRKTLPSKLDLSETLNVLGIIHGYNGESDKAIEFYKQSLSLKRAIGNKRLEAYSLNNIGENYRLMGDIEKALSYYNQCYEIGLELNDLEAIRFGLIGKGSSYTSIGEYDTALQLYEECFSLFSDSLAPFHKIEFSFVILRLKLLMKKDYSEELKLINEIHDQFNDNTIKFFSKMTKAFLLKESPRIKTRLMAQDIFEEILDDDIVNMEYTILAMQSLVELYLIELQISDNTSLLENINGLIHDMLELANEQHFYPLMIKSIILQSRIAFLNNNIDNCLQILQEAYLIVEQNKLDKFYPLIDYEKEFITEQLSKWKYLAESDASMYQKIQESHLLSYLQDIAKLDVDHRN